jgi:integrase
LLFFTATRNEETRSAEWRDVDLSSKLWTIPAAKSKTGEAHRVPLSSGALAVLADLRGTDARFLFPAPTKTGFMDAPQKAMALIRRKSGIDDFRIHDVRRTVRQRLADMDVSAHVGEAILGHLPPKIVRTYTPQWEPVREMAAALEAWSAELHRILRNEGRRGADVLPMVRA